MGFFEGVRGEEIVAMGRFPRSRVDQREGMYRCCLQLSTTAGRSQQLEILMSKPAWTRQVAGYRIPGARMRGYQNRNGAKCRERSANAGDGGRIRDPDLRRMGGGLLPDLGLRMFPFSQNPKETGVDIEYVKAQGRSGSIFLEMGRG